MNKEEEQEVKSFDAFEPDPAILKENIEDAKTTKDYYKKELKKFATIGFVFCALALVLTVLHGMGIIALPFAPAIILRIKLFPVVAAGISFVGSLFNVVKYAKADALLLFHTANFETIKDKQIELGNEKLIEEIRTIVSPKKIEKVKPPKKHNNSKEQIEENEK